jgi:hypothetical protein
MTTPGRWQHPPVDPPTLTYPWWRWLWELGRTLAGREPTR